MTTKVGLFLLLVKAVVTLAFAGAAVWLILTGHWIWAILFFVLTITSGSADYTISIKKE